MEARKFGSYYFDVYTVGEYLRKHGRSMLAKELKKAKIPHNRKIIVSSGVISRDPHSKLGIVLKNVGKNSRVIVGGRAGYHYSAGRHWAVVLRR